MLSEPLSFISRVIFPRPSVPSCLAIFVARADDALGNEADHATLRQAVLLLLDTIVGRECRINRQNPDNFESYRFELGPSSEIRIINKALTEEQVAAFRGVVDALSSVYNWCVKYEETIEIGNRQETAS